MVIVDVRCKLFVPCPKCQQLVGLTDPPIAPGWVCPHKSPTLGAASGRQGWPVSDVYTFDVLFSAVYDDELIPAVHSS